MRLRRPCEHVDDQYPEGHYDKHLFPTAFSGYESCPGGEFLADDTVVIEKASEGTCEQPLWNLGYEARKVEPQPCGMPAKFVTVNGLACNQCLADALAAREGDR